MGPESLSPFKMGIPTSLSSAFNIIVSGDSQPRYLLSDDPISTSPISFILGFEKEKDETLEDGLEG